MFKKSYLQNCPVSSQITSWSLTSQFRDMQLLWFI